MQKRTFQSLMRGTTLLELLLALSLSIFLLGILTVVQTAMEKQHQLQRSLSRLHAHSVLAMRKLERELQMAGFIGCPSGQLLQGLKPFELNVDAKGSTVLTVRHRSIQAAHLQSSVLDRNHLELDQELSFAAGDVLLISSCRHAELLRVHSVHTDGNGQSIQTAEALAYRYPVGSELGLWEEKRYFIEKTGRQDEEGRAIFAIYELNQKGRKHEWVEGVQAWLLKPVVVEDRVGFSIELQLQEGAWRRREYGFVLARNDYGI